MPERLTKSEIGLWFGVVVSLALADWLEHISRPYDVFSSIVWGWLLFTFSIYAVSFFIVLSFVGLLCDMILKNMISISSSWRHIVKYGSAILGVFISAILFPSISSELRDLFIPEFKRHFAIDGASVIIILSVFTCLWYLVYRLPWRWNLRPFRHSAFLLLLFIFTVNGTFGYFNNVRFHRALLKQSGIYSVQDGAGHFQLVKIIRISTPEIILSIADSQFTVSPAINSLPNLDLWFEGGHSTQQTITISIHNFLDWEPRLLAEGSILPH